MLLAGFEASAQRISLPDFSGRGAGAVRTQLVNQLCDSADCVAATKVTSGGKPDMKKAKRELLEYFITGAVTKKGKKSSLDVSVVPVKGGAKVKRSFPLERGGTLSGRNLQSALDLIHGVIGTGETSRPSPTPEPEPSLTPSTPSSSASSSSSSSYSTSSSSSSRRSTSTYAEPTEPTEPATERPTEVSRPVPSRKSSASKPTFLVVDLGSDVLNRSLAYKDDQSKNVRDYTLPAFPMPVVRAEVYPLALMRTDLLAGLGVEVAFGIAPYLKSRRESTPDDSYPTTAMKLDAGLRWRIVVSPTFPLAVTPFVGVKVQSFTVGKSAAGATLDGLPGISFVGLRAGLGLDVPIVPKLLYVVGRFAVLPIFSSGEIISKDYFKSGSTFGFEAGVGAAVELAKIFQIRATFEYTQYGLTFTTQEGDTYRAAGATDRYLGGNLSIRLQF